MEGKNGLDGRLYQAADTGFFQCFRGIGGVVTHRNHIVSQPECEYSVGDTGHQANYPMRMIGHGDLASGFIRNDAAGLNRDRHGSHQHGQNQESPFHCWTCPLSTKGRPATRRSTLEATRAMLWFISPNKSRKRRPDRYSGTTPLPTSFDTSTTEQGGDCSARQRASIELCRHRFWRREDWRQRR